MHEKHYTKTRPDPSTPPGSRPHGIVNLQPAVAARMAGAGVVVQLLDTRAPLWLRRATMPAVCHLTDVIMSTGRAVAEAYPGATDFGERLVPYIPPVDVDLFGGGAARRGRARALLGVSDDALLIGAVGNRNPQKGFELLIEAAARLRAMMNGVELRIVGAESSAHVGYAAHLDREAHGLGLGTRVLMTVPEGHQVAEIMPAFDVLAVSSVPLSEGIPTVLLEAMACGVPVVSTDVGSVREVVRQGVNGYVVPSGDVGALVRAIREVLHNRAALGLAGRDLVHRHWSLEDSAAGHAKAYELAIAHRDTRRAKR